MIEKPINIGGPYRETPEMAARIWQEDRFTYPADPAVMMAVWKSHFGVGYDPNISRVLKPAPLRGKTTLHAIAPGLEPPLN